MPGPASPRPLAARLSGAPESPPLVLLHSIGTDAGMWQPQLAALQAGHRVIALDLPGHGASAGDLCAAEMAAYAARVVETLDSYAIENCDLVGLSLGGMVAAAFALQYPERLQRLVICDARLDAPAEYQTLWDDLIARTGEDGMDAVAAFMTERWFGTGVRAENPQVREIAAVLRRTPAAGFIRAAEAIRNMDLLAQAGDITAPSLLLVGAKDGVLPELMGELCGAMPRARLEILPEAGHLSNVDQPDAFSTAVLAFLGNSV